MRNGLMVLTNGFEPDPRVHQEARELVAGREWFKMFKLLKLFKLLERRDVRWLSRREHWERGSRTKKVEP